MSSPAIDRMLPGGGLALGSVHEIAAATAHTPGLLAFGLSPARLILVRPSSSAALL
ncbi:hypothetical protein [Magnetospirillum gryphiswaldense]|nr:hypothetical protein [Magnetospirillum gryphiswaldense]